MFFAIHLDADADTVWQTKQVAYGGPGTSNGDDHINLKTLQADTGDRLYAAIKTSRTGGDPLVVGQHVREVVVGDLGELRPGGVLGDHDQVR